MAKNDLCNDEVFVEPELKNALITVHASDVQGATTNYLDAMSTWCPGFVNVWGHVKLGVRHGPLCRMSCARYGVCVFCLGYVVLCKVSGSVRGVHFCVRCYARGMEFRHMFCVRYMVLCQMLCLKYEVVTAMDIKVSWSVTPCCLAHWWAFGRQLLPLVPVSQFTCHRCPEGCN